MNLFLDFDALWWVIFTDIGQNRDAYEVTLSPKDILIVPANWWHYVENLDTSLTVNTWIPLVSSSNLDF